MYAVFPMIARQAHLGTSVMQSRGGPIGRSRVQELRRTLLIHHGARAAEVVAVTLSPFHRATLEHFSKRTARWQTDALLVRASGLFDARFYLDSNHDVAKAGSDPLVHYMFYGATEGRRPSPSFDPAYYARQAGLRRGVNPLLHYLRTGQQQGYPTSAPDAGPPNSS